MHYPRTLFILADGARARLVERSPQTGDFVTFAEIDARDRLDRLRSELRASPPAANRQSGLPQRHTVGTQDFFRQAKEAFAEEVADEAAELARSRGFEDVFVAAPPRLIGPLRNRLRAKAQIRGELERDLTKTPDAALPQWLAHVRM